VESSSKIDAASAPYHRILLMTLYATGVRNAELTHLKVSDIATFRCDFRLASSQRQRLFRLVIDVGDYLILRLLVVGRQLLWSKLESHFVNLASKVERNLVVAMVHWRAGVRREAALT
jgi:site-specific recombinase XerD